MSPQSPQNETVRRVALYGVAALVVGGLGYATFGIERDADYLTLIGSSQIHAELASQIPADAGDPQIVTLRNKLIADSRDFLERAERQEPDQFDTRQMHAYLAFVEGDFAASASMYREMRSWPGLDRETLDRLLVREAKALSNDDCSEAALAVLDEHGGSGTESDRVVVESLRVRLLDRIGRSEDARRAAVGLAEASADGSDGVRTAATLLESLGAWSDAEGVWDRADPSAAVRDYHRARLKLRSGETDNAFRLLESTLAGGNPEVANLLRQDLEVWETEGGRSLESLIDSDVGPAAPAAGR